MPAKREMPTLLFNAQFDRTTGFDQPPPVGRDPVIWDMSKHHTHLQRADFLCRMLFYTFLSATGSHVPKIEMRKVGWGRNERRKFKEDIPDSQKQAVWICTTYRRVPYCSKYGELNRIHGFTTDDTEPTPVDFYSGNVKLTIGSSATLLTKPPAASLFWYNLRV
ncbi:hypothetical protein FRC01_004206 [Tulasnella sp. 417]|nr:hypothetical protein FRC01_004206 [Tulasnella sp. 417]